MAYTHGHVHDVGQQGAAARTRAELKRSCGTGLEGGVCREHAAHGRVSPCMDMAAQATVPECGVV